ncbi:MAG TPA: PAS domain S-box protein [Acidimicrobiales bacterium]|nr:PAS domain S-box protein [Acidimicrobiales bacterium]
MDGTGRGLLEEFLHASPDALVVVDEAGVIQATSDAVADLFGYAPEELYGQAVEVLIPAATRSRHKGYRSSYTGHPEVRPMGVGLDLMAVRKDGSEFPVDVSLVPSYVRGSLRVGAFVRDATVRRRNEDLLRFVNQISHDALAGAGTEDLLALAARQARALVRAVTVWIAVPASADTVVVAAADGEMAEKFLDVTLPMGESLAGQVMSGSGTVTVDNLSTHPSVMSEAREAGFGAGLYIPMRAERGPVGALVVARDQEAEGFTSTEVELAEIFASAAAVVLALGTTRQALEDARVTAEHERIARDLHDTVIQRLFAIGMRLQASERLAEGPLAERIGDTVENIDQVIREIRETIFDLNHPHRDGSNVRHAVRDVIGEAASHLGFTPRINFRGPVESAVGEELCSQMIPVLREALANVGRHARASSTDVLLSVADGALTLSVADDGVGISDQPSAGNGTSNMRERAERLGGELTISRRKPSGTLLQWRVPLAV